MKNFFFTLLIAGTGAFAWLVGATVFLQRIRLVRRGLRGIGTVVDEFVGPNVQMGSDLARSRSSARFSVVEVHDVTTGTPIRFRTTIGTSHTVVEIGRQVPVRYLPGLPDQAEIDRPMSMWGLPILMCAIGTVFLALWWYLRSLVAAS